MVKNSTYISSHNEKSQFVKLTHKGTLSHLKWVQLYSAFIAAIYTIGLSYYSEGYAGLRIRLFLCSVFHLDLQQINWIGIGVSAREV